MNKKLKTTVASGLLIFVVSIFLAACTRNNDTTSGTASAPTGGTGAKPASKIVVGFSQIGAESGWRTANTESIKSEAAKRGIDLRFADAQQKRENQTR